VSAASIAILSLVALAAAVVGVVTGGNSLVTVPVMLSLGMSPRVAVGTNMFAVTFLALSGAVRFARNQRVRWDVTWPLVAITLVTSYIGARLLASLSERGVQIAVAASLGTMVVVMLANPRFGEAGARVVSRRRAALGYLVAAVLGVYGGFYSGGYTTLLTFAVVGLLGTSLVEAVGLTKVVNFASSAIACVAFARAGLIDLRVAAPMSVAMIVGAWAGASLATRFGHRYVRALFLGSLLLLGVKLVLDLLR
jgi:uncharacterized membrane protein YfcA